MTAIITTVALILLTFFSLTATCKEKSAQKGQKPTLVTSVEKIARGRTFQDRNSKNVSFTLKPTKAYIRISF